MAANISSPTTKATTGRWEFLDSLRAIAALLVMIEHWMEVYTPQANGVLWRFFSPGATGVAAFFLVSGYIIPISLEKYGSLRTFWIGRFFRLFPLYFFSMALAFSFPYFGLSTNFRLPPSSNAQIPLWKSIIGNALMMQEPLHVPYPIAVYWSLSLEGFFYLCCSALFLFGVLSKSRLWSIVTSVGFLFSTLVLAIGRHHQLSAEKAGVIVTAFFGTVLYRYTVGRESRRDVLLSGVIFAVSIVVCFWVRLIHFGKPGETQIPSYLAMVIAWGVATFLFLVFLALRQREFPVTLRWIGKVSYSIYLIHPLVLELCRGRLGALASIPMYLLGTLAVSHFTFSVIENPFQQLQHKLFPRKARLDAPSSTAVASI